MKQVMLWLPRCLSLIFILFISLFALDVLGQPRWYLGLLVHLIPSFILVLLSSFAWKFPRLGGVLFMIASLVMYGFFKALILTIPMLGVGILFIVSNWMRNRAKR